jgi:hypothetical protein
MEAAELPSAGMFPELEQVEDWEEDDARARRRYRRKPVAKKDRTRR